LGVITFRFRDGKDRRILIFSNKMFIENLVPLILHYQTIENYYAPSKKSTVPGF